MDAQGLAAVRQHYAVLGHYYQRPLNDGVCRMYAEDLADLPLVAVMEALAALRRDPKRRQVPLPADVRNLVAPDRVSDQSMGDHIAGNIVRCISSCGYTNPTKARQQIGEVGWRVVTDMGGWQHICSSLTVDDTRTFYAQCRELSKAYLETERVNRAAASIAQIDTQAPPQLSDPSRIGRGQ